MAQRLRAGMGWRGAYGVGGGLLRPEGRGPEPSQQSPPQNAKQSGASGFEEEQDRREANGTSLFTRRGSLEPGHT